MGFQVIALSVITVLLQALSLKWKAGRVKLLLGLLTAVSAIAGLVLYILFLRQSGWPEADKAVLRLYVPCGAYLLAALLGLAITALSRRKLRREKAVKTAAKAEKAARAEKPAEPEQEG